MTGRRRGVPRGRHPPLSSCASLLVLAALCRSIGGLENHNNPVAPAAKGAEFNRIYSGFVNREVEEIYTFNYSTKPGEVDAVRVYVSAGSDDPRYPVIFVVRQQKAVLSWQVPLVLRGLYQRMYTYQEVSRTLCPLEPQSEEVTSEQFLFIDVATMAPFNIRYELLVQRVSHFRLETGVEFKFSATPSQPMYFLYEFPEGVDSVAIEVVSHRADPCAVVSVQDIVCPVYDLDYNVEFIGVYQSMSLKAAITVQRKDFPGGKFYVVFVIKPEDYACGGTFPSTKGKGNHTWQEERVKGLGVTIVPSATKRVYIHAILFSLLIFLLFYASALIVAFVHYMRIQRKEGVYSPDEDDGEGSVASSHPIASGTPEGGTYGAIDESSPAPSPAPREGLHCRSGPDSSEDEDGAVHALRDLERESALHRSRAFLYVSDLSRKDSKTVSKKYKIYFWNISTIAVFYALPVVQLVITYQTVVNVTGNQDICYYNFLCAHPLGVLSAFNNILSNVGYVLLGFLFLLIVLRRDILHQRALESRDVYALEYGIPKHFGLFYAMAIALMMEGVLSSCYHVCPNYSNFQFDTSFMYMLAGLCMLKLYQTRHPDVNASAYFAYATFAMVIFLAVLGVIFGKNAEWFWILFSIIHVSASLALSTQIYYMGRFKIDVSNADIGTFRRIGMVLYNDCIQQCNRPMYMDRMVLLILGNLVNWSFAVVGLILKPKDFASYLLGIFICNLLLYLTFYIIMKLRSSESLRPIPLFCIVATAVMWVAALYFFLQNLTSWEESPAQSREQNRPCVLLHFFDDHDIWHFLSAAAMFFSFLVLLTLDDDLDYVRRDTIPVF
uniref:SID1 transmembrane family member 1 n=1 Tax=Lepisosteus oculatus TaxID=7918 RepID=W5M504_LEPOC|nr:PREDICTED: SID1 transmembrane family member 1 isoform X1 [Lepisosteus oculatus]